MINPELNRIKEIIHWRGPWAQIVKTWIAPKPRLKSGKKVFIVKRGDSRFVAVAKNQSEAETQIA